MDEQKHTFVTAHDTTKFLDEYAPVNGRRLAVSRLQRDYGLTLEQAEKAYAQWFHFGEVTDVQEAG